MIFGIWLVVLGVLAIPSLIIAKKPEAKDLIAKITPYQGWIGAVSALWGVWGIISSVLNLNWLAHWPIAWISLLAVALVLTGLGLLLGVGVLKTFIKDATAQAKMDETIAKLAPYQGRLGIAAIVLGLWQIVSTILWKVG